MSRRRDKPCDRVSCQAEADAFHEAIYEEGFSDERNTPIDVQPCGRCGIECCEYHSTAMVIWRDEENNRQTTRYNPAICARCYWIATNNGETGRVPGWLASRVDIPW